MQTVTAYTPTSVLADMIARRMAEAPGVEHDQDDIRAMFNGAAPTGVSAAIVWLLADGRIQFAHGYYSLTGAGAATSRPIAIVAREDRVGVYFTPVVATPSGDGTMAASPSTERGEVCGPRSDSIRGAVAAVRAHVARARCAA